MSKLILGCGNFGGIGSAPAFYGMGETETQAIDLMDRAWDAGIDAFDTADAYGGGRSESYIGRWLASKGSSVRDRLVITSKVFNPVPEFDDHGLSRARILRQVDASLKRLQTDRLDFYLAHEWDPDTPIEETLGAFDNLVRAGKVRHIGLSNVQASEVVTANSASARLGTTHVRCVQNSFSLLERDASRELLPLCVDRGIVFTAFGPLAGGWLTGKYQRDRAYPEGSRMTLRPEPYLHLTTDRIFQGLASLEAFAHERGVAMSTLALAWALAQPGVAGAVIGPRTPAHLDAAVKSRDLKLSPSESGQLAAMFDRVRE